MYLSRTFCECVSLTYQTESDKQRRIGTQRARKQEADHCKIETFLPSLSMVCAILLPGFATAKLIALVACKPTTKTNLHLSRVKSQKTTATTTKKILMLSFPMVKCRPFVVFDTVESERGLPRPAHGL